MLKLTTLQNQARLRRAHTLKSSPPAVGHSDLTHLRNRARLRRAYTPKSSPPAAGHNHLTRLRNRARLRRANTPNSSPPAAGPLDSSPKLSPPAAGHHVLCQTAIFETFHSISHQPGRVRGSHLVRLVRKDQAVILKSLNPIFVPDNSARHNPNTSANPQHLDLLPVLPGTLPLPQDLLPSPFYL